MELNFNSFISQKEREEADNYANEQIKKFNFMQQEVQKITVYYAAEKNYYVYYRIACNLMEKAKETASLNPRGSKQLIDENTVQYLNNALNTEKENNKKLRDEIRNLKKQNDDLQRKQSLFPTKTDPYQEAVQGSFNGGMMPEVKIEGGANGSDADHADRRTIEELRVANNRLKEQLDDYQKGESIPKSEYILAKNRIMQLEQEMAKIKRGDTSGLTLGPLQTSVRNDANDAKIRQLEENLNKKKAENDELKRSANEQEQLKQSLEKRCEEEKKKREEAERELQGLKQQGSIEKRSLQDEVSRLRNRMEQMEEQNHLARKNEEDRRLAMNQENDDLKQQLESARNEIAEALKKAENSEKQAAVYKQERDELDLIVHPPKPVRELSRDMMLATDPMEVEKYPEAQFATVALGHLGEVIIRETNNTGRAQLMVLNGKGYPNAAMFDMLLQGTLREEYERLAPVFIIEGFERFTEKYELEDLKPVRISQNNMQMLQKGILKLKPI